MQELGRYYLHVNGDLIFKRALVYEMDLQYFDSPFVVKTWVIPKESPTGNAEKDIHYIMDFLLEALTLSEDKERTKIRVYEICDKQGFLRTVPDEIVKAWESKNNV
jgi:hypothetical protein